MKTRNTFKLLMLYVLALVFNACVGDDDYTTPKIEIESPNLTATNTIKSIKDMYDGSIVNFGDKGLIIEGYVTSSDEGGNIYKALYIQDKPENPTAAIQLVVDATDMYSFYEVGRKVFVKLDGLALSDYRGMLQIGLPEGAELKRIPSSSYKQVIIRDAVLYSIVPKVITPSQIKDDYLGMLVMFDNMHAKTKGQTYGDAKTDYPQNRIFVDCKGKSVVMRNSGYAAFRAKSIPDNSGSITAILSKYNSDYQIFIRTTEDVDLKQTYDCGITTPVVTTGAVSELNETFDAVTPKSDVDLTNWIIGTTSGTRNWSGKDFNGSLYAEISGYKYDDGDEIESWLITPGLDLDKATTKNFSFDTNRGYSKGETLEVLISTDFSGDIVSATWKPLNAVLGVENALGYGKEFTNSGDIDLSSYNGVVYVAFKYSGNGTDKTGTFQLDNVKFNYTSNNNTPINPITTGNLLVAGSDFEDWAVFEASLNKYLVSYAVQSTDGKTGSALHINETPDKNGYVFTALVPKGFDASAKSKITMYIKGTSPSKSLSFNVYKADGTYARFNLLDCTSDVTLDEVASNQYTGSVDTQENWIKVTLNILGVDLATTVGESLFAVKVGKESAYDLLIDNITIE